MKIHQYFFTFLMGFFLYALVEMTGRGYTHWTMCITGGIVMSTLYHINRRNTMTLIKSCFLGSVIITSIELPVGIFDNIIMHWDVWDYSDLPLNFMGQICLFFSIYWFILCIPAFFICRMIRERFEAQKPCSLSSDTRST